LVLGFRVYLKSLPGQYRYKAGGCVHFLGISWNIPKLLFGFELAIMGKAIIRQWMSHFVMDGWMNGWMNGWMIKFFSSLFLLANIVFRFIYRVYSSSRDFYRPLGNNNRSIFM
jgi:hypothetical protein